MRTPHESWLDAFRALGASILEVARAEFGVVGEEWKKSGHLLLKAAALFGAAISLLFWIPALTSFALVALFERWAGSLWLAALWVAGIYLVIAALLGLAGYLLARRLEAPTASAKRRLSDHADWWREKIFKQEPMLTGGEDHGGE